ncbi:hypothetical protein CLV51_11155 [Chitinophaga niastensis]|uniref:Uncharacterized protein n=2 Tax=Chitinophaga niastensis TaxID=536980 RepID=A0A2P8H909_CHINA|nr:hypothetical protein CLV51_11155 [Chitinophaga niastensis]
MQPVFPKLFLMEAGRPKNGINEGGWLSAGKYLREGRAAKGLAVLSLVNNRREAITKFYPV